MPSTIREKLPVPRIGSFASGDAPSRLICTRSRSAGSAARRARRSPLNSVPLVRRRLRIPPGCWPHVPNALLLRRVTPLDVAHCLSFVHYGLHVASPSVCGIPWVYGRGRMEDITRRGCGLGHRTIRLRGQDQAVPRRPA
jgi:hypothetical protein